MLSAKNVFELAQLAEASYASLDVFSLEQAVKNDREELGAVMNFSTKQAEVLAATWSVVPSAHRPNTESGYSSTLFRSTDGSYVFALRGTETGTGSDIYSDLLSADIGDIVGDGLALKQIVDMYNEWQRINAPAGATYSAAQLSYLEAESAAYADAVLKLGSNDPEVRALAQTAIDAFKARTDVVFDGIAADIAAHGLTVTGHSLGGHLATAFTRLFPDTGAEAHRQRRRLSHRHDAGPGWHGIY